MEKSSDIVCKDCRSVLSVTPSTHVVRCIGCRKLISVKRQEASPVRRTSVPYLSASSQDFAKFVADSTGFHFPCSKRSPVPQNNKHVVGSAASLESCPSVIIPALPRSPAGQKKALLCGVTYNNQKIKLQGTNYDVHSMKKLLTDRFGFPEGNVRILLEHQSNKSLRSRNTMEEKRYMMPTKKNIKDSLNWLVKDCQTGDSLVFYFSGHGIQLPNPNNDELDGFDETILPVDYRTEGVILDDDINKTIVRPLKSGVTLHAIVDCCHSGTILDLPYVINTKEKEWKYAFRTSAKPKGTSGGRAICFSACADHELASETDAFSKKTMLGAMTFNFVKAVLNNRGITYGGILESINKALDEANKRGFFRARLLNGLLRPRISQEPLLSSSEPFNINTEFTL